MQYITAGIGFLLAAVLMAWLGVHRRKSAQKEYEDDVRWYTGTTMMKVVWIEESADERWEHQRTAVIGCAGRRFIFQPMSMR